MTQRRKERTGGEAAGLLEPQDDMALLAKAFDEFTRATHTMEDSYRRLELRFQHLEEEIAEKNRELALTSEYLNSILESMSDGVVAVDTEGYVTAFNRAAAGILGRDPDAVKGRLFSVAFGISFAMPPGRHVREWQAADGRTITVAERDSPMSGRDQRRIGAVKVFQDITEIEDLRTRLRRHEHLAALGEMAATVAHEIRNPLGGIRGFASLLARDLKDNEAPLRLVEKILQGTSGLERVVGELLEYTRPIRLQRRKTNCAELVDATIRFLAPDARPITIINTVPPGMEIEVDPGRMQQVLLNLLQNAVQSIPEEGEVRVNGEETVSHVMLEVTDTGCGMTQEQTERIFTPFYTTKEKGTGLGLAIAARIVEAHDGQIEARSQPGRGAQFRIILPRME